MPYRWMVISRTIASVILRNLGVKTLFVGGVNLDQCVMTTLEDANFLGYDTILVEDGAATTSPDYCVQAALYNIRLLFGFTLKSETLRSEEHTSELQSLMRISYAVFCLKQKKQQQRS